ncbi:DUF4125 family protein [Desulfobaculum sp. SPO524]|uniref:DUF4125 family protein n=1 Tax=Desulfobaculum sp. SPO524 TaxID=3378071 RepID=UPI0038555656
MKDTQRQRTIERIVDLELEMFKSVYSSVHTPCQDHLQTFRAMRWMTHSVMPQNVLDAYLDDLQEAKGYDRNLMVEKYARMEGRMPPIRESLLIDEIVDTEMAWMREMHSRYPALFESKGETFRTYISCELETLSLNTLERLHSFVVDSRRAGRNLVEERYDNLFRHTGYESTAHRNQIEQQRQNAQNTESAAKPTEADTGAA